MITKINTRKKMFEKKILNFGFLSTIDNPLLALTLQKIYKYKLKNAFIICERSKISFKMQEVFKERVGNYFDKYCVFTVKNKIPFFLVDSHNSNQTIKLLNKLKIDCLYNAGTLKKLNKKILSKVKFGCINVHPAILPKYRGASSTEWSIYNSDKIANTVHFMDENYDSGPIINIEYYKFSKITSYQDIRRKVYAKGIDLGIRTLLDIQKQKINYKNLTYQDKNEGIELGPISKKKLNFMIKKVDKYGYK